MYKVKIENRVKAPASFLVICSFIILGTILPCLAVLPTGTTTLNITDYGAVGDGIKFSVNTESNSTVVTVSGTNTFSSADVGKVIEVFGAGPWVYYSNWDRCGHATGHYLSGYQRVCGWNQFKPVHSLWLDDDCPMHRGQ